MHRSAASRRSDLQQSHNFARIKIEGAEALAMEMAVTKRTLSIPEILNLVLLKSTPDVWANCARVCRSWSEISLQRLWGSMDSIVPLLELVFPLEATSVEDGYVWDYDKHLSEAKWDRFRFYAEKILALQYSEEEPIHGKKNSIVAHSAMTSIVLFHPFGTSLLPNLRSLKWNGLNNSTAFSILPFVPATLVSLTLELDDSITRREAGRLVSSLAGRTPNLETLSFQPACSVPGVNRALVDFIESAPALKDVCLPRFYHTPELVGALGKAKHLALLTVNWCNVSEDHTIGKSFRFSNGAFPQLRTLHFDTTLPDALRILSGTPDRFRQLEDIILCCVRIGTEEELRGLFSALAGCCENITHLWLDFVSIDDEPTSPAFSFDVIHPLFNCHNLQTLKIEDDYPLAVETEDVQALGEAWPKLKELYLNESPRPQHIIVGSGTQLQTLHTFAACCPNLTKLGLFFDEGSLLDYDGDPNPREQLKWLKELHVGMSVVSSVDHVGFLIGSLCSKDLVINANGHGRKTEEDADRIGAWTDSHHLSKLVVKTKMLFQKLQAENAELKAASDEKAM